MDPIRRRLPLALLALALVASMAMAQPILDAKTVKAIAQKEQEIARARSEADEANRRLQDDYARLGEMFEMLKSGRDTGALRDLARVLEEPVKDGNEAGISSSKGKRALKRNLARELAKTEHELVVAYRPGLGAAIEAALDDLTSAGNKSITADQLAGAAVTRLIPPETPFWKHWNEQLMNAAPAHDDYVRARKELDRLESALLILKDPKARFSVGAPAGMALIEGGAITVESTYGFEADRRKARTKDFYIDLHEVTHGDYWGKFWIHLDDKILKQTFMPMVKDKDREFPAWIQDLETGEYAPLPEMMDLPVTGIDAAAALAFARSQGKRLPTEAEWLAAATATPGKCSEFPWGEDYREGLANDAKAGNGKAVPVAGFLEGRSFHGIHDCAGNVKEWTFTTVEGKDVEDEIPDGCTLAIRGGSFESSATGVSLKWRWNYPARNTRENDLGFRCARDLK